MERQISNRNILDRFCEEFCEIIERHCKYIIVSGFVVIASGRTRGTEDIDMIIDKIDFEKFKELYKDLIQNNFVCMQSADIKEAFNYLKEGLALRFTWKDKELPEMEMKFAKDILDEIQIKERQKLELTGLEIWFSSIEMNIAFKEELLKSQKDLEDARHLRLVYDINEEKINKIKQLIRKYRL